MGGKKKRSGSNVKLEEDVKPDVKQESDDELGVSDGEQAVKDDKKASKWRNFGGKSTKKKDKERGVVYISCLPHGFYEKQLEGYFGQFGKVTGVYVPKSKKSGKSKGYAFVQFLHPEVAQVAAETMNNYLVFNRLIKTEVVPPEKQRPVMFKQKFKDMKCREHDDKIRQTRKKQRKLVNSVNSQDIVGRIRKVQDSLRSLGVEYKMKVAGLRDEVQLTKLTAIDPEQQLNIKQETESISSKKSKKKSKKASDNTCQSVALPSAGLLTLAKQDLASKAQDAIGKKKKQIKETKDKIVRMVRQVRADKQTVDKTTSEKTAGKRDNTAGKIIKAKVTGKKIKDKTISPAVKEKTTVKISKALKTGSQKTVGKTGSKMKTEKSTVALSSPMGKRKSKLKLETTV